MEALAREHEAAATDQTIEVRVPDLRRIFHAIDPSPLGERDLDPGVEQFIVEWSREVPSEARLCLSFRVDNVPGPLEAERIRAAISRYFNGRAESTRLRLRRLFQVGRTSLLIGLLVLTAFTAAGQLVGAGGGAVATLVRESLYIGGWVAMWRPLEIFLYDWWPVRADARLFDRLASAPIRFVPA